MKKLNLLLFVTCALIALSSCSKNDDSENYYTFNGNTYQITNAHLKEIIFNKGTSTEQRVFQFEFYNVVEKDTMVTLYISALDSQSNNLGGNYPAFDQNNSTVKRGIAPFGLFFASGIVLGENESYITGEGGSADIDYANSLYSIDFNKISVGDYGDLFDSDNNGDSEYTEAGTISGNYRGSIVKETVEYQMTK